jgi:hypothetical protein
VTNDENVLHAVAHGLHVSVVRRRPILAKPIAGAVGLWFPSSRDAGRNGFDQSTAARSARIGCKHKGYYWEYC